MKQEFNIPVKESKTRGDNFPSKKKFKIPEWIGWLMVGLVLGVLFRSVFC